MSLNKRKTKQLTPLDSIHKRQSLQKPILKIKKPEVNINLTTTKNQQNKLRLKPLSKTSQSNIKTRPFQSFQKFEIEKPKQQNQMMSTFMTQSSLFASYYKTETTGWIKPSDYMAQISSLGFKDDIEQGEQLQFNLSNAKNNSENGQRLYSLVQKWVKILKKAIFYTQSQKTNSDKLSEQLKFWKILSKKFDQLQYEFNDSKVQQLMIFINHYSKVKPQYSSLFTQFSSLKVQVCSLTIPIKKLHLSLESIIQPLIIQFEESQTILASIQILRQILCNLHSIFQDFKIIESRKAIIYKKLNFSFVKCLIASNINPNTILQTITLIDPALSFLSNFISLLEQEQSLFQQSSIMGKAEYQQQVLATLLEMSMLFQYSAKQKSEELLSIVKQLKSVDYDYNIFDDQNNDRWFQTITIFQQAKKRCKLFDD